MTAATDRLPAALRERYRIEREFGQGGRATVYLAHVVRYDREVAVKVLHPDRGAALGSERLLSEIKTPVKLQHLSPGGKWLALFSTALRDQHISVMRPDGNGRTTLTEGGGRDWNRRRGSRRAMTDHRAT